ncbi:septal ring lytic transglycosylase RlpA family protein [Alteromonas sp. 1_MG-2023]|uniref:septal ring lytic transglycosylase RlpA family protein n=1 Tax=Alteromonas sp. 1_MG-2023 TaxID=3062669 RepID=UPI0026E15A2A|nr:septal ring lytic transglycosylase RlpA family protein [Alteromonas sp. 1_MG-2023]MDO6568117.1 septal ring lytic transglycosylase RlpA family protein [Alteromonas sp. 1_MG-2023]
MRTLLLILIASFILAACQSAPSGRYTQHQDTAPNHVAKVPETLDAVPRYEAYRMFNSRPYKVLGKHYTPLTSGKGFEEVGYASWYGQKFHGHLTSNGETYNMFAMSAAHKTLPLPSYVRVTNLDNNKQAIVRVNDRGPFHDNRIIDLSYAAAVKLDYHNKGTAKVKIEVIHFDADNNVTVGVSPTITYDEYIGIPPLPSPTSELATSEPLSDNLKQSSITLDGYFIQVAALSNQEKAESISNVLSALYQVPTHMPVVGNMYKLQLGPIEDEAVAHELLEQLKQNGYPQAYKVKQTL